MEPHDPNRPSYDPRRIVREQGRGALAELLMSTGYVPQPDVLNALALSLRRAKAILLGGRRGGGKTVTAESLAAGCNLTMFYVPGIEGQGVDEVYGGWDREAQKDAFSEAIAAGHTRESAVEFKWMSECFSRGEVLDAYNFASEAARRGEPPPVLVIDEVEKLSLKIQNTLLQPLARGWANVPKLKGVIGVRNREHAPIVVLTSNNLKLLSEPLRSRCEVAWVELPQPHEEVAILISRVPGADIRLLGGVVKMLYLIREDMPEVRDKPGLRESIDLLESLVEDGVRELTENVIHEYLPCIGKDRKELINLRAGIWRLADAANSSHDEIDGWIESAFVEGAMKLEEAA